MRLSEAITEGEWRLLAEQPSRCSDTGRRNLAVLHAMYFGGLRVSDLCDLSPWDLNGRARGISRPTATRRASELVVLPTETWSVLEEWADRRPRSPYFFSTLSGNRLKEDYVGAFVRRYADRAGITKPTRGVAASGERPLGSSYATRLLTRGLPDCQVARRLTSARLP